MKLATVVFLEKNKKIILAKKKSHIHTEDENLNKGAEKYNGYGGKFEGEKDKSILDTAVRELFEETGGVKVEKENLFNIGEVEFFWPGNNSNTPNMLVYFYITDNYQGYPIETNEMYPPEEFFREEIPYSEMMGADKEIIPKMLKNENGLLRFSVHFSFEEDYKIELKEQENIRGLGELPKLR